MAYAISLAISCEAISIAFATTYSTFETAWLVCRTRIRIAPAYHTRLRRDRASRYQDIKFSDFKPTVRPNSNIRRHMVAMHVSEGWRIYLRKLWTAFHFS